MKLILSTDGRATERYSAPSSTPLIDVPEVENIAPARWIGGADDGYASRSTAHVELSLEQAATLVAQLCTMIAAEIAG